MKSYDGYLKRKFGDDYILLAGNGHKALSDFSMNGHTHLWINGYNFYYTSPGWSTSYGPVEIFETIGIPRGGSPKIFAAFTSDNGYKNSLFWSGYGEWGLTELRSSYTSGNAHLQYRVSTSNQTSLWGNFHDIANLSDIPSVYDGTLSLLANSNTVKSFTANSNTNVTLDIKTGTANGTINVGGTNVSVYGLGTLAYDSTSYLATSGGEMSGAIKFNRNADSGLILNKYGNNYYNVIRTHNNGNISISASGGGLYLGYENTSIIYARGTHVNLDTGNLTASKSGLTLTITINGTSYSLTNSTYSTFVASGSAAASGLVPKPDTTSGTVKFLCEDATWKKVDWSYLSGIPSTFTPSDHDHSYILGTNFYENTSVIGSGHHAMPTDWTPSVVLSKNGINTGGPCIFAAFSEPNYRNSLFWSGYGSAGLTEIRSLYNGPDAHLLYRVAYGFGANTWGNFYTIANTSDIPTKSSWNYDDIYVKSVSISGTNLRVNKNGSNVDTAINAATLEGNSASAFASAGHTHDYAASTHYHSHLRHSLVSYSNARSESDTPDTICNIYGATSSSYSEVFPGVILNSGGTRYMSLYWTAYGSPGLIELNSLYGANAPLRFRHAVGWNNGGANWYGFREIIDNAGGLTINGNLTATNFYTSSDSRLKTNINKISKLLPIVEFDWKESGEHSYGFIAQELESLGHNELVSGEDNKTVNYNATLALYLAQLSNIVEDDKTKIARLEARILELERRVK